MNNRLTRCGVSALVTLLIALHAPNLAAQTSRDPAASDKGYWAKWFQRSDRAKEEQPHWITPLATTTPRLEQEFRYDVLWQQSRPGAKYTQNLGNGKGLELIPFDSIEIIAGIPPYVIHHSPSVQDGFGDFRMLVKYRLLSANETTGNYIVTAFLDASLPTAQGSNGQSDPILTPTIAYGKGFGHFDVQGTFAAALPAGNEAAIGRTYTWNNAFQYQFLRRIWPEIEVRVDFFEDGKNDGKKQVLITPGLLVGRIPLTHRLGLTVGGGVQIAASDFHTTQHNIVASIRLPF